MKILLINAFYQSYQKNLYFLKKIKNIFTIPSLSLKYIATITPKTHSIKLVDEAFDKINFEDYYDLVGISCVHTSSAIRSYQIADEFRSRGKTVVLGGYHPSALPEEAKEHADSVVVGEADEIWPQLLKDFENNQLKPFYYQQKPVESNKIPITDHSFLKKTTVVGSIQASRGCPYECEFCAITNQKFGCVYRTRQIEDVIEEIKSIPQRFIIFHDSSFSINLDYAKNIFENMKKLNKNFRCWMNANIPLKDKEFLKLASEAGCIAIEIGFESTSQSTIDHLKKNTNVVRDYKSVIRSIHDHGIATGVTFVFGFDTDNIDAFNKTSNTINELDIDVPKFGILTPLPGTPLFEQMDQGNRIITKDWSKYDMGHVVFKPKNMTKEELLYGSYKLAREFYSTSNLTRRIFRNNHLKFYSWLWSASANLYGKQTLI